MKKILLILSILIVGCSTQQHTECVPIEKYIYVPVKDPAKDFDNIKEIVYLRHQLELTRDSLNMVRDSLGGDLFIANYKLARIKEYNIIAGKGNNIKYLRGWINRVLEE